MTDRLLQIVFNLTGSRAVSELISRRRLDAKWRAAEAAHMAAGGVVATYRSAGGEAAFLL